MHRIAPAFVVLVFLAAACGSSDSDGGDTTLDPSTSAESVTTESPTTESPTTEPNTTSSSETTTEEPTTESTESANGDELDALCEAYLRSITFGTIDEGQAELAAVLGPDAPPGVQDALAVLGSNNADIEQYFAARDAIDGYVVPVCAERFAANLQPASSSEEAADQFHQAVVAGDRATAERLAPTNVVVLFSWTPFPEATTSGYNDVDGSFSMLLEPTVSVFCRAADGVITFCAFGE